MRKKRAPDAKLLRIFAPLISALCVNMAGHSKKDNIAIEQLEDGIKLFLDKRYISSLTLLGAAEEIFWGLIEDEYGIKPFDAEWKIANKSRSERGVPNISKGEIRKIMNEGRNSVKHHDVGNKRYIYIHKFAEAFMMIQRATAAANALGLKYKHKKKYEKWFNESW